MLNRDRPLPLWRQEIEREHHRKQRRHSYFNAGTIILAGGTVALAGKSLFNTMRGMKKHSSSSSSSNSSMNCDFDQVEDPCNVSQDTGAGNIEQPVHTVINNVKEKVIDGMKHHFCVVKAKHNFKGHSNFKHLMNMLFPSIRIEIKSYGTGLVGSYVPIQLGGPSYYRGGLLTNGITESFYTVKGQRSTFQFLHINGGNGSAANGKYAAPHTTLVPNACPATGITFGGLMAYSRDATNLQARDTTFAPYTNSNTIEGFWNALSYRGGSTTHHFYNTGNGQIQFEYRVCRPKTFLPYAYDPLSLVLQSKHIEEPTITTVQSANAILNNFGASRALTSPTFKISTYDRMLHEYYLVTKPKKIVIAPGETVHIQVEHPPFEFSESLFNTGILNGSMNSSTNESSYYPFCTCWLVCTMLGPMATDDAGTTGQIGNTVLNYDNSNLAHWQDEHHEVMSSIAVPPLQKVVNNFITDVITDGTDFVVDTKTGDIVPSKE